MSSTPEEKSKVVYLINNDLDSINQALIELEEDIEAVMIEAINQGCPLAAATGILYRIAMSLNIETEG